MSNFNPFPGQDPGLGQPGGFPSGFPTGAMPADAAPGKSKKSKSDKPKVTRRVVSRHVKIGLLFGLIFAAIAAYLLTSTTAAPTDYVVRAKQGITALSVVTPEQFEAVAMDPTFIEPGTVQGDSAEAAMTSLTELIASGRLVVNLYQGQQIRPEFFSAVAQLATPLAADERLIAVNAALSSAVAGQVQAGDRVDIYVAVTAAEQTVARMVLPDVEVVSVNVSQEVLNQTAQNQTDEENRDKTPSELLPSKPIGGTYVLRVKDADVNDLVVADAGAVIYLVLRGADAKTPDDATPAVSSLQVVCGNTGRTIAVDPTLLPVVCLPVE